MPNKTKTKKRAFAGSTVGLVSIIAIIVILVLAIFASLSMVTAKNDMDLSKRMYEDYISRYDADYQAMEIRNELYTAIFDTNNLQQRANDLGVELRNEAGKQLVAYEVKISKKHKLSVVLVVNSDSLSVREWDIVYTDKRKVEDSY